MAQDTTGTRDRVAELANSTIRRLSAYGSCRCRGRQERAHRPLENAQNAFPTAPTGYINHVFS